MATNEPPRRVSRGWILGLSKKGPFKDTTPPPPPKPPKPNEFAKMMTTPGGVLEWTASDGRRNALTGKGKMRLTAALASVPAISKDAEIKAWSQKAASQKAASQKAASQKAESDGGFGDLFGAFGGDDTDKKSTKEAETTKDTKNEKKNKGGKDNTLGFTEEEDARLTALKNTDGDNSWEAIAKELGKDKGKCKGRWNQIKPKDWKGPEKGGGGGGGGGGKKDKGKGGKGGKDEEKKEEDSKDVADPWGGGDWGGNTGGDNKNDTGDTNAWGTSGGGGGDTNWGATGGGGGDTNWGDTGGGGGDTAWGGDGFGTGNDNASKKAGSKAGSKAGDAWNSGGGGGDTTWGAPAGGDTWGNNDKASKKGGSKTGSKAGDAWNSGGDGGNAWDSGGGGGDTWGDNKGSKDNTDNAWGAPAPATKAPSAKHSSKSRDKPNDPPRSNAGSKKSVIDHKRSRSHDKANSGAKTDIRLYPDDTFSASDLKQIARILHQDRALVWERLAHRFADRTDRRLPPEVFERKFRRDAEKEKKKAG